MGIYVNPGKEFFEMSRNSEIYVDKSMLISKMNMICKTEQRFLCISRPRRFGKSMAANMLAAYYSCGCDASELFSDLKVAQEEKTMMEDKTTDIQKITTYQAHLNQHQVIHFDVQQFLYNRDHLSTFIGEIQKEIVEELKVEYGDYFGKDAYELPYVLKKIYAHTKKGFIFIIDEWDCVFRLAKGNEEVQKSYLDFLRGLFKGTVYVDLVYMTGILPIKKYGEHSALNIFNEYSMTNPADLSEYFGFTEEEVQGLCKQYDIEFDKMSQWYDGYNLKGIHIYNPRAVVDAVRFRDFQNYWTGTETYEALKVYIEKDFDDLKEEVIKMLGGGRCETDPTAFQNDMTTFKTKDDVLALLVHLGYLTYDVETREVFIPNREVAEEFMRAMTVGGWDGLIKSLKYSEELLKDTWELNETAVAEALTKIHNQTTSMLQYNNENSLACVVYIAYYSAKAYYANPMYEMPTGKGFADIVYLPLRNVDRPALVVELKWNKSAKGAIEQIKERQYADWIESYTGDILLVGINYNKEKSEKKHECIIEKYTKE